MKRLCLVVVFLLLVPAMAMAQAPYVPWKVSTVSVGAGENPISSGLSATLGLLKMSTPCDKPRIRPVFAEVTLQSEQGWIVLGKMFTKGPLDLKLAGSAGHFQGAPWVGPFVSADLDTGIWSRKNVYLGALYWPAWYPFNEPREWEEDGVKNPEKAKLGHFGEVYLATGGLRLSLAGLDFLDDSPVLVPGVSYKVRLPSEDISVSVSVSQNRNTKKMMYFIGVAWAPLRP